MGLREMQTETVIALQADLTEDLERLAARQCMPPGEIVAIALHHYVRQMEEQKIQEKVGAFRAMHAELMKRYRAQVVAVHEGQVVDHDEDFFTGASGSVSAARLFSCSG